MPTTFFTDRVYEVDEMATCVKRRNNRHWICCAFEGSQGIISLSVGRRSTKTLRKALAPVMLSKPRIVYSDGLKEYRTIIDKKIHVVKRYHINHMERKFLDLRTHLKRLSRGTQCFSKTVMMLEATVRIYIWHQYYKNGVPLSYP